jgi:WD40 repeat protein
VNEKEEMNQQVKEMVGSLRCISLSPDGSHLASGDKLGNIRIHDLESSKAGETE